MRRLHKAFGRLIYRYVREPISTRLPPQWNRDLRVSHFVRRLLGLHYYE